MICRIQKVSTAKFETSAQAKGTECLCGREFQTLNVSQMKTWHINLKNCPNAFQTFLKLIGIWATFQGYCFHLCTHFGATSGQVTKILKSHCIPDGKKWPSEKKETMSAQETNSVAPQYHGTLAPIKNHFFTMKQTVYWVFHNSVCCARILYLA